MPMRSMSFTCRALIASSLLLPFASGVRCGNIPDSLFRRPITTSLVRLASSTEEVADSSLYPTYGTHDLRWKLGNAGEWTSGFYPGCLWYAYALSGERRFEHWAERWTSALESEKNNTETHDLGFKFMCSFGNGLLLDPEAPHPGYRKILLEAARTLADRYNPVVGCLSSNWDIAPREHSFPVIIDIMMNLELLFWASDNGGPSYMAEYARNHAATTLRDFIRPGGGTYHIVRYDRRTGKVINKGTMQEAGDSTTWARGHAWGLYGMVVAYRYTKERRFLAAAMKLGDYFIDHLPSDHVSPWDFQSDVPLHDVSATSIVASALFELSTCLEGSPSGDRYRHEATAMLSSLCAPPFFANAPATHCLLDHAVQYYPIRSNVDVPAIFADYYFLEGLYRFRKLFPR
jgi:unsaturated chondroitin disaccharide hydrolase